MKPQSIEVHTAEESAAVEKLSTYGQIADALGVSYVNIQRAAKRGLFPVYRVFNGRPLLRMSEVLLAIEHTRSGGK